MTTDLIPSPPSAPLRPNSAEDTDGLTDAQRAFADVLARALADIWQSQRHAVPSNAPVVSDPTPQTANVKR